MKVRRERNYRSLLLPVVLVLAAAFLAAGLGGFAGNEISGAQVIHRSAAYPPSGCNYMGETTPNYNPHQFIYANQGKKATGNDYCKSIGYDYAAFVDTNYLEITLDSIDGSCDGKNQIDEIVQYHKYPGNFDFTDWWKSFEGNTCITKSGSHHVEPQKGDVLRGVSLLGVLCCKK